MILSIHLIEINETIEMEKTKSSHDNTTLTHRTILINEGWWGKKLIRNRKLKKKTTKRNDTHARSNDNENVNKQTNEQHKAKWPKEIERTEFYASNI